MDFHKNLTVIVGINGAGKTSILEAIAIAVSTLFLPMDGPKSTGINKTQAHLKAYTMGSTSDVQVQYPVKISATAMMEGREVQWERCLNTARGQTTTKGAKEITSIANDYQNRLRSGDAALILPVLAYYGTGRLWDYHREKQTDIFETSTRTNGYIDSIDGTANVKLMMNWFAKMTIQKYQNQESGLGAIPELDAVYSAMEKCCDHIEGLEDVKIQYNMGTRELDIAYTDVSGKRMRMPINQLSDGYKSTISLVADIAYRMAVLNPQCLNGVCSETDGIVLIDEIDLHLHPQWQKQVLKNLMDIFPKVQFVVSTHAPEVITSVRSENLVILRDAQIHEASSQVYGKDVKSVLKEVMDVDERPQDVEALFKQFYQHLSEGNFAEAEENLDRLDELREYHDPEVAACRVKLRLEKLRGGAV